VMPAFSEVDEGINRQTVAACICCVRKTTCAHALFACIMVKTSNTVKKVTVDFFNFNPVKSNDQLKQTGFYNVGMAGFEPTTSSTPCWRDTRLRYIPIYLGCKSKQFT
jgi:hypothetical protein